jgi:hypothetical protein
MKDAQKSPEYIIGYPSNFLMFAAYASSEIIANKPPRSGLNRFTVEQPADAIIRHGL